MVVSFAASHKRNAVKEMIKIKKRFISSFSFGKYVIPYSFQIIIVATVRALHKA